MFENAKWIARRDSEEELPAPLLRKSFDLDKEIKNASLAICGLGLGEYYINGEKVSDEVLITPYTNYDKTVIYSVFNVTKQLCKGANAVGAILGNGCYYVTKPRWDVFKPAWMHHPKLIAQLDITYEDGSTLQINSGKDWKTNDSALIYNRTKRGEYYDARKEIKDWCRPEYDDTRWDNAFICRSPGGVIRKMKHPPIRITKEYPAHKISDTVYDLGQNISGWVKIKGKAKRGTKIIIKYAECLDQNGLPDYDKLNTIIGAETHTDTYIFSGKGVEEWSPRFVYHGFRYFEILGAPAGIEVTGQMLHTDVDVIGDFECSDEMLNKLHHMTRISTLTNLHGVPTDCPQREQNGWTGDALLSCEQSLMNYDMTSVYDKWLRDIRDVQRPSGQIPSICPTAGWGYNWSSGPAWDSFLIQCPYLIYKNTGSTAIIKKMWTSMKKYMEFMQSMTDNYLQDYGLGDWCPPDNAPRTPTELTDTAYYYTDAVIMAKCASLTEDDPKPYMELAKEIRRAFREKYVTDGIVNVKTQTALACAIYNGLLADSETAENARILNELVVNNSYNTTCGILGNKFIYSALSDNGYAETAYKMTVNPDYPSYAYWVNNGMTTLCEMWDMKDSLNHHMYSEVDMWFYKHLSGINIDADRVIIKPSFLPQLSYVKAHHRGIYVEWDESTITVNSDRDFTLIINNSEYKYEKGQHVISRD